MAFWFCLRWWYSSGFRFAFSQIGHELQKVGKKIAIETLIKTLFAPWKQISSVGYRQTLGQKLADATVSRGIGFLIRISVLLYAITWSAFITLVGLVFLVLWPFIPLLPLALPVLFFMGVTF